MIYAPSLHVMLVHLRLLTSEGLSAERPHRLGVLESQVTG
jgi:hypothetical protein